jgi:hypothetical protein
LKRAAVGGDRGIKFRDVMIERQTLAFIRLKMISVVGALGSTITRSP